MNVHTEHIATKHQLPLLLSRILFIAVLIIPLSFISTSCMPVSGQQVNAELFESKEDLKTKAALLNRGMSKLDTFQFLGIPPERFEQLSTTQIQHAIYGVSQVQGTPDQLEKFKKRLLAYDGYALPYSSVESNSSIGFAKMKTKTTGYQLNLILIFENNALLKASVEGVQDLNKANDQYLWNSLLKTGVKAAF